MQLQDQELALVNKYTSSVQVPTLGFVITYLEENISQLTDTIQAVEEASIYLGVPSMLKARENYLNELKILRKDFSDDLEQLKAIKEKKDKFLQEDASYSPSSPKKG